MAEWGETMELTKKNHYPLGSNPDYDCRVSIGAGHYGIYNWEIC